MNEVIGAIFFGASMFILGVVTGTMEGFRSGQVACLTDDIRYELVEQDNKEIIWRKIKESQTP